jgi:hypothetical protein
MKHPAAGCQLPVRATTVEGLPKTEMIEQSGHHRRQSMKTNVFLPSWTGSHQKRASRLRRAGLQGIHQCTQLVNTFCVVGFARCV